MGRAIRHGTGTISVLRPIRVLRSRRSRTGRSTFARNAGLATVAFGAPHSVQDGRFREYRHGVAAKMWTKSVCPAATHSTNSYFRFIFPSAQRFFIARDSRLLPSGVIPPRFFLFVVLPMGLPTRLLPSGDKAAPRSALITPLRRSRSFVKSETTFSRSKVRSLLFGREHDLAQALRYRRGNRINKLSLPRWIRKCEVVGDWLQATRCLGLAFGGAALATWQGIPRCCVWALCSFRRYRLPGYPTKHRSLCQARKSLAGRSAVFSGRAISRPCSAK